MYPLLTGNYWNIQRKSKIRFNTTQVSHLRNIKINKGALMQKFILDAKVLIRMFPEPLQMKINYETEEYLFLRHEEEDHDVDMCTLELGRFGFDVELRQITISENYKGQGFGMKVLTCLIILCEKAGINLFSYTCNEISIHIIRSAVEQLCLTNIYNESSSKEVDGEFCFEIVFIQDTNFTLADPF